MLLNSVAYATGEAAGEAAKQPTFMDQLPMLAIMFLIFYFLIIRPQGKKAKTQQNFWSSMKRGDSVLTSSGILGTIEGLTDKYVTLEIADGVKVRILKSNIAKAADEEQQ